MNYDSPYLSNLKTVAKFSAEDFLPDANLDKPVWRTAQKVLMETSHHQQRLPEARTEVAALWSSSHLYFAFWSTYSTLNIYSGEDPAKERWELWNRDVVEVFINPFPERINAYWEFEVAPNNQWIDLAIDLDKTPFNDASWDSGFDHATRVDEAKKKWYCEMRIPVSVLGVQKMRPGMEWRINFYRCDGFGDDTQRRFLAWSPTMEDAFHVPSRFGLIRFEGVTSLQAGCISSSLP